MAAFAEYFTFGLIVRYVEFYQIAHCKHLNESFFMLKMI